MQTITDHKSTWTDNEWEPMLICNIILYITGYKVWQLIGCACNFQIMSNNEMPLDCAGESMKINLSLSLIWSRETKLHFLDHRPCCGYFVWIHGRVTLVWIDQSCVWWAEALSLSLSLPAAGINGEWASLRQKQHKHGLPPPSRPTTGCNMHQHSAYIYDTNT